MYISRWKTHERSCDDPWSKCRPVLKVGYKSFPATYCARCSPYPLPARCPCPCPWSNTRIYMARRQHANELKKSIFQPYNPSTHKA